MNTRQKNKLSKKLVHIHLFLPPLKSEIVVQEYPLEQVSDKTYKQKDVDFASYYYEDDMGSITENNEYFEIQDSTNSYNTVVSNFIDKYSKQFDIDISKVPVSYRVWN